MADQNSAPQMQATLGLTGLTSNAMALIAPGAFLWLTFFLQATTGATSPSMWIGIFAALMLCLATAVSYAEISKLYPGTGSSYYYAEQAMLSKDASFNMRGFPSSSSAGAPTFTTWGLSGRCYGGRHRRLRRIYCGLPLSQLRMSGGTPGPVFMALIAVVFTFAVAAIAQRGANASTSVNLAINVVQISALVLFSILAIGYRVNHPQGAKALNSRFQATLATYTHNFATKADGKATSSATPASNSQPQLDADGKPVPFTIDYSPYDSTGKLFQAHPNAKSVISMHSFNWMMIQATVAILIPGRLLNR